MDINRTIFREQNPWREGDWRAPKDWIERALFQPLIKWLDKPEIIAIKGSRQVGKTTLALQLADYLLRQKKVSPQNIFFFSLESSAVLSFWQEEKERVFQFLKQQASQKGKIYVFIDEFQYLNEGGKLLKIFYDADYLRGRLKFVITGSSSLEITGQTGKYLVGRMLSWYLYPFSFGEILKIKKEAGKNFLAIEKDLDLLLTRGGECRVKEWEKAIYFKEDLKRLFEEYCLFGGYPRVILSPAPEERAIRLQGVLENYLQRDIGEILKEDIVEGRKILKLLALQIGNLVSWSEVSKSSGLDYRRIKKMANIFEQTFIFQEIKPFYRNKRTELVKAGKVFFQDTGIRNVLIDQLGDFTKRTDVGALVENAVFTSLHKRLVGSERPFYPLKFWRTRQQAEIDFIIESGDQLLPIEVKYQRFTRVKISRGLRSFVKKYQPKAVLILTRDFLEEVKLGESRVYFLPTYLI